MATGWISDDPGASFVDVEKIMGMRRARHAWHAWRRAALDFAALLRRLDVKCDLEPRGADSGSCLGHIAVMQGAVWQTMGLGEMLAQLASAYGVASGVTAAAVRLGAIGALEGQKILRGCLPLIETRVAQPVPEDADLSSFIPFLEIAAARHARADLRLFAN